MPRRPALRAIALASGLVLVIGVLGTAPVVARGTSSDRPAAGDTIERDASERGVQVRGRVDVEDVARSVADTGQEEIDGTIVSGPTAGDGPDIAAAAPGLATTNTTPPPTLTTGSRFERDAAAPAPMIAVGPDHVVRSDELLVHITNRIGTGASVVSFADLFLLPAGTTARTGRIWFEPSRQRWIAVEASGDCAPGGGAGFGHGFLDIAVSDTADPRGGWSVYFFSTNDRIVSDPGLGTSLDKLILTSSLQPMAAGCGAAAASTKTWDLTSLDWADLLAGGENDAAYFTFDPTIEWVTPAFQQPAATNTAFVVADESDRTLVMEVTGSNAATLISDIDDLFELDVVNGFAPPLPVTQGPGSFTPSAIPTSVVWRYGRLVIAGTEPCIPAGDSTQRNCARIVDLLTNGPGTARRQDLLIGANATNTYNPGVGFSGDGELVIAFDRSTLSSGPTLYVSRQQPGDAAGTISASVALAGAAGVYRQPAGPVVVGLAQDPLVPDAVWVINVVGSATGSTADPAYDLASAQARTSSGATFKAIAPLRVVDSRSAVGLPGALPANAPRTFQVGGVGAIPANAVAVTANVTVANQNGSGYVSITPLPTATPTSSTINFPVGDNRANNVTVSLDPTGKLSAVFKSVAGRVTHLIVDVTGYFVADASGATYKPLTPARLLDTRVNNGASGPFVANVSRYVQITGRGGVPATGVVAITGNLTVTGQTNSGYVTMAPVVAANPATSTINFPAGDTRANGLTVPLTANGAVAAVYKGPAGRTAHLILDVTGYYVTGASGLRFYPLAPGRIMDTRQTSLTLLAGKFTANVPRSLPTSAHFGVPAGAQAITGNLTVTGQSKAGYVSVTKAATSTPAVSTLNFPLGDNRANGITVPLDASGRTHHVYKPSAGSTTHLILDLTGYFQ